MNERKDGPAQTSEDAGRARSKLTPGPWRAVPHGPFAFRISAIPAHVSEVALLSWDPEDVEGREATRADADLIAAAPELLDALRAALPWASLAETLFDRPDAHPDSIRNLRADLEKVRAAIAKAEGRS